MRHPFPNRPGDDRRPVLAWIFGGAVLLGAAFFLLDPDLRTDASPLGIVSFELAFDPETARAMVEAWAATPRGLRSAGLLLGGDYLFMLLYAVGLSMLATRVTARLPASRPRAHAFGALCTWGLLASGLFDAIENFGLAAIYLGGGGAWAAPLAGVAASLKFALLGVGGVYLLVVTVATMGRGLPSGE